MLISHSRNLLKFLRMSAFDAFIAGSMVTMLDSVSAVLNVKEFLGTKSSPYFNT